MAVPGKVILYPQPARNGRVHAAYVMAQSGTATLTVYNLAGQMVAVIKDTVGQGGQVTGWDVGTWASGVYFVKVNLDYNDGSGADLPLAKFLVVR